MATGFDILDAARWSAADKATLKKYFKGKHHEWNKNTLATLRLALRSVLLRKQGSACAYCRRFLSIEIGHNEIDHIVAKAIEGMGRFTYERMNLVAACKRCNKNKKDHNPLVGPIAAVAQYPTAAGDYLWVHPYIHPYSEHIAIREEMVFEAIGDAGQRARALAVITVCKLDQLSVVESRRAAEQAVYAETAMDAVLTLVGKYPSWSNAAIARAIRRRKDLKHLKAASVTQLVSETRAGSYEGFNSCVVRLGIVSA